jgi:amidase
MIGERISAERFALALRRLQTETRRLARLLEGYDAVLTPTLGQPPVELGTLQATGLEARAQHLVAKHGLGAVLRVPFVIQQAVDRVFRYIPFTPVANFTGQPSMSVPLFWNRAGLPIGVMLTARFGDEATLLRLAAQLEEARPWRDRKPPISA